MGKMGKHDGSSENGWPEEARAWHAMAVPQVEAALETDANAGLGAAEAARRLQEAGRNRLEEEEREPFWREFLEELREPLILLLIFTGLLYVILGEAGDGITIFVVILLLVAVEVVNEQRATRAIAALQKIAEPTALVVREGRPRERPVEEIVPGDVVVLQAGRRVPADGRVVEGAGLTVDESALTGESAPVSKDGTGTLEEEVPLAERINMVYSGTLVTRGRGKAIVVGTGMATELGRVAGLARGAEARRTPLQEAMGEVSKLLVWVALGLSVLIPALGVLIAGEPLETMIFTGLSLAFATIPEELPIIITMVLGLGAYRLSREHAIVKDLQAVETLGAVTVIATDKTGTLTQNRMEVSEVWPDPNRRRILAAGLVCNDALVDDGEVTGDPLEVALVEAARQEGIDSGELERTQRRVTEFSFENARQRMSVVTQQDGGYGVWVKGAPESLLSVATRWRTPEGPVALDQDTAEAVRTRAAGMAERGLRVMAFAEKSAPSVPADQDGAESELTLLGLAGLLDPPRDEVAAAIEVMKGAGIRSLMVTGDHPLTARAIAGRVGLDGKSRVLTGPELDEMSEEELAAAVGKVSIFARTTPEHKLRIVEALKAQGERVAVTGDGINDAPALATADIGVAMGETGSDVAREAGDIVLADDNYTTIANAVREGRILFANLKKGVRYYLAVKVALVSVMLLPVLLRIPVPFAPIQLILMELFMDLAAAAAFVAEPAEGDLMRQRPRDPQARFLDRAMIGSIVTSAAGLFAAVTATYLYTWLGPAAKGSAGTAAFAAWMVGHVMLAFNLRSERQPIIELGPLANRVMDLWAVATVAFLVLVTNVPFVQAYVKTVTLRPGQWALVVGAAAGGTFWMEVKKAVTFPR
jgi:Ca2+-transporting ATPase